MGKLIYRSKDTGNSVANYSEYKIPCDECDGTGVIEVGQKDIECPECEGKGYTIIRR